MVNQIAAMTMNSGLGYSLHGIKFIQSLGLCAASLAYEAQRYSAA